MEERIKNCMRRNTAEGIFHNFKYHFSHIRDYVDFFIPEDSPNREYSLNNFNELFAALIRNARYRLSDLHKEKIEDIFSEEAEIYANARNIQHEY